jgi:hypothetical protein
LPIVKKPSLSALAPHVLVGGVEGSSLGPGILPLLLPPLELPELDDGLPLLVPLPPLVEEEPLPLLPLAPLPLELATPELVLPELELVPSAGSSPPQAALIPRVDAILRAIKERMARSKHAVAVSSIQNGTTRSPLRGESRKAAPRRSNRFKLAPSSCFFGSGDYPSAHDRTCFSS